jgi:hypothetical protein
MEIKKTTLGREGPSSLKEAQRSIDNDSIIRT